MRTRESDPVIVLLTLVIAVAAIIAKIYLYMYVYTNLLLPQFSDQLPTMKVSELWGVVFGLSIIFSKIPEKDNRSSKESLDRAGYQIFAIAFQWLFAWLAVAIIY